MESLINEDKQQQLSALLSGKVRQTFDLDSFSVAELLELRQQIESRLPASELSDMNLEQELVYQFLKVKELQDTGFREDRTPLNQKAQVANSVATTLDALVKMQKGVYTSERFKAIENFMIQALKKLPRETAEAFLEEYEGLGR